MSEIALQAKHVSDELALSLGTVALLLEHGCRWPYFARHPAFPRKVILAKLRSLQQRGVLMGCAWPGVCAHQRPEPKVKGNAKCDRCKAKVPVMDENDVVLEEIEHAIQGCNGGLNT